MSILIRKAAYFDEFRCIGGSCPDSCCKEWDVQVDGESAARYRRLPGALGDKLRSVLKDVDGETLMQAEKGHCPMWREDGLCRIQAELGEQALCHTCREFPRIRHDYGDFVELGLELSCPEAAKLILRRHDGFVSLEQSGEESGDYDREVMDILLKSREELRLILNDDKYKIPERFAIALMHAYHVQALLDGEDMEDFDRAAALEQAESFAAEGSEAYVLSFFSELEILSPQWAAQLSKPAGDVWRREHILLAEYFMDRYWLQTVSDLDLVCRAKFMLISCLVVKLIGGDIFVTAQRYCKEIENNMDNVEALLDTAYSCPALTDNRLLGLLLC